MSDRVTEADLAFAIDWVKSYDDGAPGDPNGPSRDRIVAWLRKEIEERRARALARVLLKKSKATPKQALEFARRYLSEQKKCPTP